VLSSILLVLDSPDICRDSNPGKSIIGGLTTVGFDTKSLLRHLLDGWLHVFQVYLASGELTVFLDGAQVGLGKTERSGATEIAVVEMSKSDRAKEGVQAQEKNACHRVRARSVVLQKKHLGSGT
jgi:hypothetical protein